MQIIFIYFIITSLAILAIAPFAIIMLTLDKIKQRKNRKGVENGK